MDVTDLIRKEGIRRKLSEKTIKIYSYNVQKFLQRYKDKEIKKITNADIKDYLYNLAERGAPGNTLNVILHSLRFLFVEVFKKKLTINIKYCKVPKTLPVFLTKEEIVNLFNAITNHKHRLMTKLLYGTGMRISELLSLKIKEMDFQHNYGWIRQGKGRKDRLFIIPLNLKEELLEWIKENNLPEESWVFLGQKNLPVSASTVREILKKAAQKAGIKKKIHPHRLRHSFATHLIENGYAVTDVQPLLGHNKIDTTMIYLHLASPNMLNVKSPFDGLPNKSYLNS